MGQSNNQTSMTMEKLWARKYLRIQLAVVHGSQTDALQQGSPKSVPRAKSGPRVVSIRPARPRRENAIVGVIFNSVSRQKKLREVLVLEANFAQSTCSTLNKIRNTADLEINFGHVCDVAMFV